MTSNTSNNIAFFTVCNIAYLPKALVLAESVRAYTQHKLKVVVFDRKCEFKHPSDMIELIWAEDLGVARYDELAFIYDIIEFSTSLKPLITLKLLQDHEKVVFLDPDTCLLSSAAPIVEALDRDDILLTPHHTTPQPSTVDESDLPMMRFGSFNLGFFAVRRTEESQRFLSWWSSRCIDHCFMESQFGLSTDQKWVTIAPCFFPSLKVIFNQGWNAAPWNTYERQFSKDAQGQYIVNDKYPLTFFHFSNFDPADTGYMNKRASSEKGQVYAVLQELGDQYAAKLKGYTAQVDKVPYAYDYMSDGSYISPALRRAYWSVRNELPAGHDPFDAQGPVGAFARKNHLRAAPTDRYKYPTLKEAQKHSRTFDLIYGVMRLILRFAGPSKFYDLSKLMVYLSMYRKQRGLWKI
jgi:hypothetical protein